MCSILFIIYGKCEHCTYLCTMSCPKIAIYVIWREWIYVCLVWIITHDVFGVYCKSMLNIVDVYVKNSFKRKILISLDNIVRLTFPLNATQNYWVFVHALTTYFPNTAKYLCLFSVKIILYNDNTAFQNPMRAIYWLLPRNCKAQNTLRVTQVIPTSYYYFTYWKK